MKRNFVWILMVMAVVGAFDRADAQSFSSTKRALVTRLESKSASYNNTCSATFVNFASSILRDGCRIVTNAHCFYADPEDPSTLAAPTVVRLHGMAASAEVNRHVADYFLPLAQPLTTRLIKVDPSKDLAELEVPASLKPMCERYQFAVLDQIVSLDPSMGYSNASLGYHLGRQTVAFTRDYKWPANGMNKVSRENTKLEGIESLYRFDQLQMKSGMSGGPIVNSSNQLMAINIRFIPEQAVTLGISMNDIVTFLKNPQPAESANSLSGSNTQKPGSENGGTNGAGENGGANGGENGGANGGGENGGANGSGENGGANGGGTAARARQNLIDPLGFLREPPEGVMIKTAEGKKRLLALPPFQIDGFDDVRKLKNMVGVAPLFAGSPEFLRERKNLLQRMTGEFMENLHDSIDSNERMFLRDDSGQGDHESKLAGNPLYRVTVDQRKNSKSFTIILERSAYDAVLAPLREAFPLINDSQRMLEDIETFQGTFSDDYSSLTMMSKSGNRLTCKNEHYLKLICSSLPPGQPEELSLSLTMEKIGEMNFRHSRQANVEYHGQPRVVILYRYGKLMVVPKR